MRKIRELLKGARRIELFFLAVATAVLLLQGLRSVQTDDGLTTLEKRLSSIITQIEGVGNAEVMIMEDEEGNAVSVLVVAEGANDIAVNLCLQYSVQTLLGVDASKIEIVQSVR